MTPALYAFLIASGTAGVSRPALQQWAHQHARTPGGVLRDVERAVMRGTLGQRTGHPVTNRRNHVVASVVYYVPAWRGERRA